jgi:hypothetical protein
VVLVPAGHAGAESTADCCARLNAVRARAGLPRASASTLPALARAAAGHAAYRVRVDPGDHPWCGGCAAMLAAKAPLAGGTVYHVRVSGYVPATAGGPWTRLRTRTWSFTTA